MPTVLKIYRAMSKNSEKSKEVQIKGGSMENDSKKDSDYTITGFRLYCHELLLSPC